MINTIKLPASKYASAERKSLEYIKAQNKYINNKKTLTDIINNIPDVVFILNENRQIIFSNKSAQKYLDTIDELILGARPGEILDCIHSKKEAGGCGTSAFCRTCGAINSILNTFNYEQDVQECRIRKSNNESLDLRVWSKLLHVDDKKFLLFTLQDISDEKRRKALERIFFHDILNTASSIKCITDMMLTADNKEIEDLQKFLQGLSNQLIDEIKSQKELLLAETDELSINITDFECHQMVEEVINSYRNHHLCIGKKITFNSSSNSSLVKSDKSIVKRVLGNALKNALEASKEGDKIIIMLMENKDSIDFFINNPCVMSEQVKNQIFQRSFSTKGSGRGLGTYSIKLLTEKYLQGSVDFTSVNEIGTTFNIKIPKTI